MRKNTLTWTLIPTILLGLSCFAIQKPGKVKINNCLQGYTLEFVSCKAALSDQSMEVRLKFEHKLADQKLCLAAGASKALILNNETLDAYKFCVNEVCGPVYYSYCDVVPRGKPATVIIQFKELPKNVSKLSSLKIGVETEIEADGKGAQKCVVELKNIPVKWE